MFYLGNYGTQYRVRFYPAFGYSMLHKECNLTRFNHQKTHYSGLGITSGGAVGRDLRIPRAWI